MEATVNLLVISDDPALLRLLRDAPSLASRFALHYSPNDESLLPLIKTRGIKISIIDINGSRKEELSLLRRLKRFDTLLDVLVVGNSANPDEAMAWIREGATDYLARPVDIESLQAALDKISERRTLRRETFLLEKKLEKKYVFEEMISRNLYMLEIFSLIENISNHFTSVLITGETGTGKEMVARAIHRLSPLKDRKLVICDCTSIPENLFESELFGYARGAFTGADRTKKGLFEEADGGIIFLDEIAEIPIAVQSKLLRVLETRQFRPLGSNENKSVQVRIIAATSRNLRERIRMNSFREDLYHRLNRVEIHLPPLRERQEDIPLLVRNYLEQFRKQYDKNIMGVSRQVQKAFLNYLWPGNIRELINVLENASLVCKKEFIDIPDLPQAVQESLGARKKMPFVDKTDLPSLEDMEKEYIEYVLKATRRNLRKAASILGVSRTTLYNKLEKFNITR